MRTSAICIVSGNAADIDDVATIPLDHARGDVSRQDGNRRNICVDHRNSILQGKTKRQMLCCQLSRFLLVSINVEKQFA